MGYREDYFKENKSNNGWYTCTKCGKKLRKGDVDIDHIIPQKHGGSHKLYNLQCLCRYCNRSKQASLKDVPKDLTRNIAKQTKKEISKKIEATLPVKPKAKSTTSSTSKSSNKKNTAPTKDKKFLSLSLLGTTKVPTKDSKSTTNSKTKKQTGSSGISLFGNKEKKYITLQKK